MRMYLVNQVAKLVCLELVPPKQHRSAHLVILDDSKMVKEENVKHACLANILN